MIKTRAPVKRKPPQTYDSGLLLRCSGRAEVTPVDFRVYNAFNIYVKVLKLWYGMSLYYFDGRIWFLVLIGKLNLLSRN